MQWDAGKPEEKNEARYTRGNHARESSYIGRRESSYIGRYKGVHGHGVRGNVLQWEAFGCYCCWVLRNYPTLGGNRVRVLLALQALSYMGRCLGVHADDWCVGILDWDVLGCACR